MFPRRPIFTVLILLVLITGGIVLIKNWTKKEPVPVVEEPKYSETREVIGISVEGREIESYSYLPYGGTGEKHLVFVGGIHGGYEWNSVLLSYEFMDYLK